jgi:hypothetical protein
MSFLSHRSHKDSIASTLEKLKFSIPEEAKESELEAVLFAFGKLSETAPATAEETKDEIPSEEEVLLRRLAEKTYHASEALFKAGTIPAETLRFVKEALANRYDPRVDLTAFARKPEDDKKTDQ